MADFHVQAMPHTVMLHVILMLMISGDTAYGAGNGCRPGATRGGIGVRVRGTPPTGCGQDSGRSRQEGGGQPCRAGETGEETPSS